MCGQYKSLPSDRPYLPIDYECHGLVHCTKHAELLLQDAIIDVVGVRRDAQGTITQHERELV